MYIDQNLIADIVDRAVEALQPSRIILFGSAASGTMTSDSDIDLLVLKEDITDLGATVWLLEVLQGLGFAFDVFVMTTERFEESKYVIGGLAFPADKYGEVIYEAA